MGVNYDAFIIYGMKFDHDDAEKILESEQAKDFLKDLEDDDNILHLWEEWSFEKINNTEYRFYTSSPWFDSEITDRYYYIGLLGHGLKFFKEIDENKVKKDLYEICEKLNLTPQEIKIHCDVDIS